MKRKGHVTTRRHRSDDARPGDRARIIAEKSLFSGLEGTVRNVYHNIDREGYALTLVFHVNDVPSSLRELVPPAPDGGLHYLAHSSEIDIVGRTLTA